MYIVDFVNLCMAQVGDRYVFGAEASYSDPNPSLWDCSELVEWACARGALQPHMPDGSGAQYQHCRNHGTGVTVQQGIQTFGALLFVEPNVHVAVSLGNGKTVEARGRAYGVGNWDANGRSFNAAARIPGMIYGSPPAPPRSGIPVCPINLMYGTRSDWVKLWQSKMWGLGFPIQIDGVYGSQSENFCRFLQATQHLAVDGIVGPQTWNRTFSLPDVRRR